MPTLAQEFENTAEEAFGFDLQLQHAVNECFERVMSAAHMMHDEKKLAVCVESVAIANEKLQSAVDTVKLAESIARGFFSKLEKDLQRVVLGAPAADPNGLIAMLCRSRLNFLAQLRWSVRLLKREFAWVRNEALAVSRTVELLGELDNHLQGLASLVSAFQIRLSLRDTMTEVPMNKD